MDGRMDGWMDVFSSSGIPNISLCDITLNINCYLFMFYQPL